MIREYKGVLAGGSLQNFFREISVRVPWRGRAVAFFSVTNPPRRLEKEFGQFLELYSVILFLDMMFVLLVVSGARMAMDLEVVQTVVALLFPLG